MKFLNKHKRLFLIAGMLICVVAIILTVNPSYRPTLLEKGLGYVVAPLQKGATAAMRWTGDQLTLFSDIKALQRENEALKAEINELQINNQRLKLADEENKKLSALLSIAQKYAELPTVGAEIIGKAPTDWYDSFNIDKGSDDGLTRNMAILGNGGLLGVIRECYPNYAKVVSILDNRFVAAVKNVRTGDVGVVKGDLKLMSQGLCRMEYISADAQILPGDELITSPHSSIFPPGIKVGTVLSIEPSANGMTKYAIVEPFAQVDGIETVLVVHQLFGSEDALEDEPVFWED